MQVGPATITINRDDRVLVCQPDGSIAGAADDGFFARDTRFVSGYRLRLNGQSPVLLNSAADPVLLVALRVHEPGAPRRDGPIPRTASRSALDRTISGGVHEDLDIVNYARRPVRLNIELEMQSDFADIFDVKGGGSSSAARSTRRWFRSRQELRTTYLNREFRRELVVVVERSDAPPQYANGRLRFVAQHRAQGRAGTPALRGCRSPRGDGPPAGRRCRATRRGDAPGRPAAAGCRASASTPRTGPSGGRGPGGPRHRGAAARGPDRSSAASCVPAAGVPWFVTLFGRDTLIVSMQAIGGYPEFADGALRRLAALQATADDPERDMEPGKIPHEIRHGELASSGSCRITPYYGTHDATRCS